MYNTNNIFARILRGEVPYDKVYEDTHVLAFKDIAPKAPVHVVIISKGPYVSYQDFSAHASDEEILSLSRSIAKIAQECGVEKSGYRLISNHGVHASQEVPHFHLHLLGGASLGPILTS